MTTETPKTARILLVDDDADILFVARLALKRGGYQVTVAEGGDAALELLDDAAPFDLIICDRMMPQMSGLETLEALRKRPVHARTPFMFLTAKALQNERDEGLLMGACRYLTKPFEPRELVAEVTRVLAELPR